MRITGITLAGAALLLCCGWAQAERCPSEVRVSFPNFDFSPYVRGHGDFGTPPGLLVEWTARALASAGCSPKVTFKRRPPNRQLVELQHGLLDILPGFAYADTLAGMLAFPMRGPSADPNLVVIADYASLYVRAGERDVKWDGKTLTSPNRRVGHSTGGPGEDRIGHAYAGWQLDLASTPPDDLRKLLARRVDVILEPEAVFEPHLAASDRTAVRKLSPPALVTNRYAPVSIRFRQAYPEFTDRFWLELCRQSRAQSPTLPACQ